MTEPRTHGRHDMKRITVPVDNNVAELVSKYAQLLSARERRRVPASAVYRWLVAKAIVWVGADMQGDINDALEQFDGVISSLKTPPKKPWEKP